jgi:hypothetical protein
MKFIIVILTAAIFSVVESDFAQGFTNLNFESASLVPAGGFYVQFNQAFPGWIGTVGGVQQTIALSNTVYLDTSGISIINHGWSNPLAGLGFPYAGSGGLIQGNYTAILMSGLGPPAGQPADTTLSQTGLVPANAQSLFFEAYQETDGATAIIPFGVTLGGQTLSYVPLATGPNYTLYGANISSWAGQTAQLSFTVFAENPHGDNQYLYLDAIQFSTQSVPEPCELALVALGTWLLGFRRRTNSP